jgi:hypothetical protein
MLANLSWGKTCKVKEKKKGKYERQRKKEERKMENRS